MGVNDVSLGWSAPLRRLVGPEFLVMYPIYRELAFWETVDCGGPSSSETVY